MAKNYKILHHIVGSQGFTMNQVVAEKDFGPADLDRLIDLGAIEETDEDVTTEGEEPVEADENAAFRTPTGTVVDRKGLDRPTAASPSINPNLVTSDQRAKLVGKGAQTQTQTRRQAKTPTPVPADDTGDADPTKQK